MLVERSISKWLNKSKDNTRTGYTRAEIHEAHRCLQEDYIIGWEQFLNCLCRWGAKEVDGLRDYDLVDWAISKIMSRW